MADEEGRERRGEDLFEDLDKFFAPIQDVDWPEEGEEPGGSAEAAEHRTPEAPAAPASAEPVAEQADGEAPAEPAAGEMAQGAGEGDLLPDDWAAGIEEGIDLDLEVPPAVPPEEPAPSESAGEPTQQMSAEDWAELGIGSPGDDVPGAGPSEERREPYSYMEQFLPDEEQLEVPEFGYGSEPGAGAPPVGGTTGIDWDQPSDAGAEAEADAGAGTGADQGHPEDSGPITIDDLRRPPEAYRDLPGPEGGEEGAVGAPTAGAEDAGPLPGFDEEPEPADVEAAAEHFAESIREEEPDLGLAPAGGVEGFGPEAFGEAAPEAGVEPLTDDLFGEPDVREPYSDRPEPLVFPEEGEEPGDMLSFGEPEGPRTVKVGAAEGEGPSWQEPTSVEVPTEAEQEPPRPGRNIPAAIVTGLLLAVVAAVALLLGKPYFGFVASAIVLLAQLELYTAIRRAGYQPAVPLGLAVGGLICAGGYLKGEAGILAMTAVGALFIPVWYMATPARHRKAVVANMGMTMFGIVAVPFLAGYALLIIHAFSRAFTIAMLGLAFGFDIAAYAIGTFSGNKPLAPSISPNKTREGAIGGFLVLFVAFGLLLLPSIDLVSGLGPTVAEAIGLTVVASLAAVFGDLAESLVKRDLGVKDMGTVFPGHGGALDRIDSILFVAPVVYYFVRIFLF
ncbi:MAG: phosphatidate cytidylyltransferase [Actinomycetota bacterium]